MKKSKFLPAIALTLGLVLAFAFKTPTAHPTAGEKWYFYSNLTGDGDVNNPANYQLTGHSGMDDPGCNTSTKRCAVFVQPSTGNPNIPDQTSLTNVSGSNIRHKA